MATNSLGKNIVFPIYKADGTSFEGLVLQKATYDSVVMSLGDKITGDVYYKDNALAVTMQEYIEYKNNPDDPNEEPVRFHLVNPPTIVREGHVSDNGDAKGMTKYSFEFYHPMYALGNFPFTDVAVTDSEEQYLSQSKTFSWIGNCYDFINKLNVNLRSTKWFVLANTDEQTDAKMSVLSDVLSFDKNFISEALKTAYDTWEVPFVIDSIQQGEYLDEQGDDYYTMGKRFVIIFGLPSNEIVEHNGQAGTVVEATIPAIGGSYRSQNPVQVQAGQKLILESLESGAYPIMINADRTSVIGGSSKIFQEDTTVYVALSNTDGSIRYFFEGEEGGAFVFRFGQGVGLKNNSRTPKNNKIITRISGFGSETNIPYGYPQIVWYGDKTWNYTINNQSGMQDITIGGRTFRAMSYPIYDGIVGGKRVRLIKHPFTRTHLMPSIYSQTVFNKVSQYIDPSQGREPVYSQDFQELLDGIMGHVEHPDTDCERISFMMLYNLLVALAKETPSATTSRSINGEGFTGWAEIDSNKYVRGHLEYIGGLGAAEYDFEDVPVEPTVVTVYNPDFDPETQIKDYYDAPQSYPNPIVIDSPSFEIHEFEKIKPQLGEAFIIDAVPYDTADVNARVFNNVSAFLTYLNALISASKNENEKVALTGLYNAVNTGKKSYSASNTGGAYTYSCTVSSDEYYLYIKYTSDSINIDAMALYAQQEPSAQWNDKMNDNGEYVQSYFKITLPQLSFDLYASAAITEEMKINMRSGACIGCTFTVQVDWEDYKKVFYDDQGNFDPDGEKRQAALDRYPYSNRGQITVIVQKETETFGTLMPNIYQQPKTNDKFVILGISLPLSYITNAETELDDAMMEYMLENNVYYYDYPLKFDPYFLATHTDILAQIRNNTIVRFMFAGVLNVLYVKQITRKYGDSPLPVYDITLTDDVEVVLNQIGQVTDDVSRMRLQVNELQKYYAQNIDGMVSSKLSRISDDVALGRITFQQGLDAMAAVIFYDELRSPDFETGLYDGRGWRIDSRGNAELESLKVRSYLEVVELLINRLQAQEGDTAFSDNDQIDYVEEVTDGQGGVSYILSLKEKYDGYITGQMYGNVVKGIINTLAAKQAGVSDEEESSVEVDGSNKYYTSWMQVVETHNTDNSTLGVNQIRVVLYGDASVPADKNFPPCQLMTIARWGCVDYSDPESPDYETIKASITRRQRMFMISTSEGRVVKYTGVDRPILRNGNYGVTIGELPEFVKRYPSVHAVISNPDIGEHSDWLYAQGIVVENFIKIDKQGLPEVNFIDCGEWVNGGQIQNPTPRNGIYLYNEYNDGTGQYETHNVWHNGSYWRCLQHQPVTVGGITRYYEPTEENQDYWAKLLTSGSDGENAVQVTLDNQHEDFVYNDSGTNMTGEVTSQAHLWDGNTEPSGGVTWKVSCDGGVTFVSTGNSFTDGSVAKAKISSAGLLTVSEIKASPAKVVVQATYKGTAYTADFTANKTNQDKYELILNPTGIPYNPATFTTQIISISAIRTDLEGTKTNIGFGSYTDKSKISTTSGKGTLRLFARYKANSSSSETDYQVRATPLSITPTIAGANNGIYFELRKYADPDGGNDSAHTIADYQTVTINKAENGQNGQNGQDGQDASPVRPNILLRTIFDQGIDFVKEKWESNDWRYAIIDTATDTVVQGRKSIRLNANSSSADVNFLQNVYGRVKPSTWYTLSFYYFSTRTPNAEGGFWYTFIYDGSSGSATQAIDTSAGFYVDGVFVDTTGNNDGHQLWNNSWNGERHTLTFKTNSSFSTTAVNILFRAKKEFNEQVCICMPKLEEGSDATAYVPNEDDTLAVSYEVFCPLDNVVIPSDASQVTLSSAPTANVFRISGSLRESYPLYYRLYWRAGTTYTNEGSASSSAVSTIPLPATYQSSYDALVVFVGKANTVSRLNYIAKAEVSIIRNGNTGARGKMSRNIYYAGTITEVGGTYFSADDYQAPYVDVLTGADSLHPNCYVYVGANTTNPIQFPPTVSGYQTADWELMVTDFRYLITQAIFSQFAKLGGAIFNKDWLFSQYGLQDVTLYRNDSGDYVDELSWKVVPNQNALSVEEGYEYTYVIKCNKTSGASSNVTFRVFYSTDGGTNYTVGARAIGTSNTTRHDETMTFVAERTGLAKIYFYGYGYCYLIKTNRSSRYQDMSPEFPNSDASIMLLANAMSTSSSDGVAVVNTSISVRQGYSYKFKARGYRQGSAGLTLFAKRVSDNTTVLSSILTISNTTATDASATVTIPSSVGSCDIQLWVKSGSGGQTVVLETLEVEAVSPFVPTAAIDWLTGYAHFGGDKIRFNQDGSGFLAGGNVKWDKSGNTNVEGIVTAKMMYGQQLNIPWYAGIGTEVLTAYTIDPENNPANVFVARCTSNNGVRNLTITLPIAGDYEGLELKFLCSCSSSRYLRIKAQGSADVYFVSEYDGTYGWHSANTIQVKYDTLVVAQSIDGVWHVTQGAVGYSS